MSGIVLHDYWRSTAAYRVRIALNIKGLAFESVSVNLLESEQKGAAYRALNPQGRVPTLEIDGVRLTQSLSIVEYLDAVHPDPPLVPADPMAAAHVRSMAQLIASDIHPLNNLGVLRYLEDPLGADPEARAGWYAHWVREGFAALEAAAKTHGGDYLSGDRPGLADLCLVPQFYNARRFDVPVDDFPTLLAYDAKASALESFERAHPDHFK